MLRVLRMIVVAVFGLVGAFVLLMLWAALARKADAGFDPSGDATLPIVFGVGAMLIAWRVWGRKADARWRARRQQQETERLADRQRQASAEPDDR
jgi:hypothetical protein